jgi:hypothetical protein
MMIVSAKESANHIELFISEPRNHPKPFLESQKFLKYPLAIPRIRKLTF